MFPFILLLCVIFYFIITKYLNFVIELPCILKFEYIVNSVFPCFSIMNYPKYTEMFFLSVSSMDNPDNEIVLYLMLRAVDRFHKQHGRYPGKDSN